MGCCALGDELARDEIVLAQTENFFLTPSLGPIGRPGYLLLCSKECFKGMGDVPEEHYRELDSFLGQAKAVLEETYHAPVQVFEHGPRACSVHDGKAQVVRGGGCLDHAHLHLVPGVDIMDDLAVDMVRRLDSVGHMCRADRVEGFQRAAEISQSGECTYFMAESGRRRLIVAVNYRIPSQYIRQLISRKTGSGNWDWKVSPEWELVQRTYDTLEGRFH